MSSRTIRENFMKRFARFDKPSRNLAVLVIAGYIGQIALAAVAGIYLLSLPLTPWVGAGLAVTSIFIGTRLRGFNNIVHECSHFTFTQERQDNIWMGSFCASMVLGCYRDYRDEHLTHHMHLGDYDKDMDLSGIKDLKLEEELTWRTILRHVITPFVGLHLPYYLGVNLSARDGKGFLAMKIALLVGAFGLLAVAPLATLVLIWVPFIWVYSAINYWTDCMDHGGLLDKEDDLSTSRNMLAPKPLRALFFPRNDCFHLVHHLFPQVPTPHLEECHHVLMSDPNYVAHAIRQGLSKAPAGAKQAA